MGWGGRLFEAGRLLTFSAFGMGAFSRWVLIRGWRLGIQINTVTLLEKSRFFNFFNFLILDSKNTFFLSRIASNTFCWLFVCLFVCFLPKIKRWKSFIFFYQNCGLTPLEKSQFSILFLNLHFFCLKMLLSFLEYHKTHFPGLFFF